jgi:hypothetical protein
MRCWRISEGISPWSTLSPISRNKKDRLSCVVAMMINYWGDSGKPLLPMSNCLQNPKNWCLGLGWCLGFRVMYRVTFRVLDRSSNLPLKVGWHSRYCKHILKASCAQTKFYGCLVRVTFLKCSPSIHFPEECAQSPSWPNGAIIIIIMPRCPLAAAARTHPT